jgi:hypothetical protein
MRICRFVAFFVFDVEHGSGSFYFRQAEPLVKRSTAGTAWRQATMDYPVR